jgi:16S rRNA U516 pseudouridylate synthase RsuA-like enzyme
MLTRRSVLALRRRVLSVGRLDVNTSGLLLLTNCGHLKQVSVSARCMQSVEHVIFCGRR